jgi:hypothetical protein
MDKRKLILPFDGVAFAVGRREGEAERKLAGGKVGTRYKQVGTFSHDSLYPTETSWGSYEVWRRSKCRFLDHKIRVDRLEDIQQGTMEFIGELAELSELFQDLQDPMAIMDGGKLRGKLLNEAGDCFFTGSWALNAWGGTTAVDNTTLGVEEMSPDEIASIVLRPGCGQARFKMGMSMISGSLISAMTYAGMTANAYKKERFQRRAQDAEVQQARIKDAMVSVALILYILGSNVSEAMATNIEKLDHRFPNGYQPGMGGGDRTGKGA